MTKTTPAGTDLKREIAKLRHENDDLRGKILELKETLDAIHSGEVDAIVVTKGDLRQVYTLEGADHPYRALVENIREGALTLSRDGTILYANCRFAEMVQLPQDKVAGSSLLDHICPEHRQMIGEALKGIRKSACQSRVRIRQEKGNLPVLISMNPLSRAMDTRISVVVTDRRKDEERLSLQARMLDAVGDAVIATDPQRRIIYWNAAATKIYGRMAEDALGHKLAEVKTRDLTAIDAREIEKQLMNGIPHAGEYTGHHRDGREFPVYVSDAPVFDDNGKLVAIIGISHDITENRKAEAKQQRRNEELDAANRQLTATRDELTHTIGELRLRESQLQEALAEKENLLSEIHHRVKNNLAAFISLLSLDGSYENTEGGRLLRNDLQNRARSMALIHETLYRTGKYSSVDMGVYLQTLVGQITVSYASGAPVRVHVGADGVILDLSRATTAGLIVNELVTNSFKYAFPPGFDCAAIRGEPCTIRVCLVQEGGTYLLAVSDNGRGLPANIDPHTVQSLGLKLVNFLARHQLMAEMEIHTENGTEFTFRLNRNGGGA
jgi:PAS domain S-box-containing protein